MTGLNRVTRGTSLKTVLRGVTTRERNLLKDSSESLSTWERSLLKDSSQGLSTWERSLLKDSSGLFSTWERSPLKTVLTVIHPEREKPPKRQLMTVLSKERNFLKDSSDSSAQREETRHREATPFPEDQKLTTVAKVNILSFVSLMLVYRRVCAPFTV